MIVFSTMFVSLQATVVYNNQPVITTVEAKTSYVIKSKSGKCYHKTKNCSNMHKAKATKITLAKAKQLKLRPCKKCYH